MKHSVKFIFVLKGRREKGKFFLKIIRLFSLIYNTVLGYSMLILSVRLYVKLWMYEKYSTVVHLQT